MSVTERLHQRPKENWKNFLEDHFGMDLQEHPGLLKIRIHRWGI